MVRLPLNATDEEILAVCREWLRRAARDDYEAAASLLYAPPNEHVPAAADVRTLVRNYGAWEPSERHWRITPPEDASRTPLPPEIDRRRSEHLAAKKPGYTGSVWFPVPLNGEWSDLVVTFDLRELGDCLVLSLVDVDVP